MKIQGKNSLIAYYSRKGNNYVSGNIVNLLIGNTKVAADIIQELTNADVFEIDTVKAYPIDYKETTEVAMAELKAGARPKLSGHISDMDKYDVIFLGYPNWWGTMPMVVWTFLENYKFAGKTIIPFCTNEGSGMGSSEKDIKKLCPEANVLPGLAIRGSRVGKADTDIRYWLENIR